MEVYPPSLSTLPNLHLSPTRQNTLPSCSTVCCCINPQLCLLDPLLFARVLRLISPLDVDAVLDLYIAQGLDRDPYWCRAWPSAICLAQQLLQRPELVAGGCATAGRAYTLPASLAVV